MELLTNGGQWSTVKSCLSNVVLYRWFYGVVLFFLSIWSEHFLSWVSSSHVRLRPLGCAASSVAHRSRDSVQSQLGYFMLPSCVKSAWGLQNPGVCAPRVNDNQSDLASASSVDWIINENLKDWTNCEHLLQIKELMLCGSESVRVFQLRCFAFLRFMCWGWSDGHASCCVCWTPRVAGKTRDGNLEKHLKLHVGCHRELAGCVVLTCRRRTSCTLLVRGLFSSASFSAGSLSALFLEVELKRRGFTWSITSTHLRTLPSRHRTRSYLLMFWNLMHISASFFLVICFVINNLYSGTFDLKVCRKNGMKTFFS